MENFSSNYLFCFLALSLGKCWNTALDFVNYEEMTTSNFRLIHHTIRNSSVRRFTLTFLKQYKNGIGICFPSNLYL